MNLKTQQFYTKVYSNGVTVLGERMASAASCAIAFLVPIGAAHDPDGLEGSSLLLAELMQRGAGSYDNKKLSEQFEDLGIHRHQSAGIEVSVFSASMLPENLPRALELYSSILLEPMLPDLELEMVKELALQDIEALEDEPASKVMTELAKKFYPTPFGRSQLGTAAGVKSATSATVRTHYVDSFRKKPLYISIAGKFEWDVVITQIEKLFESWNGLDAPLVVPELSKTSFNFHLAQDTSQVQIALAYPSVSFDDKDYYTARVMVGVLSGGMAGRLFIEVREKLGLVYRVGASHSAARGRAAIFSYAGTTPENAQTTFDVMLRELRGISDGVSEEELRRAKVDLKTSLIMQSELPSVRSSALVNDWWNLGRLRTLQEIRDSIEIVTAEDIVSSVKKHPVSPITLVTLGPKGVEIRT